LAGTYDVPAVKKRLVNVWLERFLGKRKTDEMTGEIIVDPLHPSGKMKPWWEPWDGTGKPLLLVDPNWIFIDQLPSSYTTWCVQQWMSPQ